MRGDESAELSVHQGNKKLWLVGLASLHRIKLSHVPAADMVWPALRLRMQDTQDLVMT